MVRTGLRVFPAAGTPRRLRLRRSPSTCSARTRSHLPITILLSLHLLTEPCSAWSWTSTPADDPPKWWSPFHRHQVIDPLSVPGCESIVPGFDPQVVAARDSMAPVKTLDDLRNLQPGQKVLVVAPRFGLGNTLRNWVSAFFWGLWSGRRIVILHGGKFHAVYTSLCMAFKCAFDHIIVPEESEAVRLLDDFQKTIPHSAVGPHNAREMLYSDAPIVFSHSYAFWDHWWTTNRTFGGCACAAIGNCRGGGGFRAGALHALVSGGPSEALSQTVQEILKWHPPTRTNPVLPLAPEHLQPPDPATGLAVQFDIGLHIRTRAKSLEAPGRPFGRCRPEDCERLKAEEEAVMRDRYLNAEMWECVDAFLLDFAKLKYPEQDRAITIFLATDNMVLREEFVERLSRYGPVYYNGGGVAHVGVSKEQDTGRLPTMAEFFLLGKSHLITVLDNYFSTFTQFAGGWGNNSIASLPRVGISLDKCTSRKAAQFGMWRKDDPRRVSNKFFKIEP